MALHLLVILALVHCSYVTEVWASYTIQIAVLEFSHMDSKLWDGNCCDLYCSGPCNSTFHFCLREAKCIVSDGCPCTNGLIATDHSPLNSSSVSFSVGDKLVGNISNPLHFRVTQWEGTLHLKIEIKSKAGVDTYNLIDEVNINEKLPVSESLSRPVYYSGTYDHVRLRLSFRVLRNEHDEHSAVNIFDTPSYCHETNMDCGTPSTTFHRTTRDTNNAAKTVGSNFYIGFMKNYAKPRFSNFKLNKSMVFIATDSSKNVEVFVTSGYNENFTIPIAKRSSILSSDYVTFKNKRTQSTTDRSKALQFQTKSGTDMSLFAVNEEYTSVDGYTALPYHTVPGVIEYHYYAVSVPRSIEDTSSPFVNSAFLIIASASHTTVTITPTQAVMDPLDSNRFVLAGQSRSIILNELETLYITSPDDLTGSHVVTDKPISFISGHECGRVPHDRVDCNHLVEQIPPTAVWGKQFFISSISSHSAGDLYKIVAASNDTTVNVLCTNSKREPTKNINVMIPYAGFSKIFSIHESESCIVTSKNPILLVQFAPMDSATIMVMVPATHQYLNTHWFTNVYAGDIKYKHYMKIFVSHKDFSPSLLRLDGETVSAAWKDILCNEGTVCGHVGLLSLTDGAHVLSHDDQAASIGMIVYGISDYEGYGYIGGMQLTPLINTDLNIVIVPPKMTSFVINAGDQICFECNTKPSTPEAHQFISWSVNTVVSGLETLRLPNGTLCISKVKAGHTGTYKCRAGTDSLGYTLSVIVGIIVTPPPPPPSPDIASIGIGMDDITYVDSTEKQIIHIYCPLEALEDTPTWSANGTVLQQGIRYVMTREYLRIQKPLLFGCTIYKCKITFASYTYEESSTVCIRAFYAPTNLTISGPSMVIEGRRFYLDCKAKAFPMAAITWSTRSGDLPENGVTNYGNGTIKLRLLEGNETTYCCTAVNSKHPPARNCTKITVILLPHIKKPSSFLRRPGDCRDVTSARSISEHIGMNLCYNILSSLYLHCVVDRGKPQPNITWFKDGSALPKGIQLLNNGTTILFQNTTTDLQAKVDGHPEIGGNYTCIATNPSGSVAASSIVIPFGDISQKVLQTRLMPVQEELYRSIHTAVSKSVTEVSTGHKHVVLLRTAKPLFFEDFNPGKIFDGSEKSVLPRTMENMFNLVDIIPRSLPMIEETWPLYKTYQNLINKLIPISPQVAAGDLGRASQYLKELVVDLDNKEKGTQIPRISLYLQYKNSYHTKDLDVRKEMELQRSKLSHEDYSVWYASKGVLLERDRDNLYMKWETLGDKSDVEKRLELLDLQDRAKPLLEIKAIIQSCKQSSLLQDDEMYMPVQYVPSNWYDLFLPKRVDETSDQIRFYHAILKSKLLVLEQANTYFKSVGDQKYKLAPNKLLDNAELALANEVKNSEMQRYQCILTRGPLECQLYSEEVNSITHLMGQYTHAFWAAEQHKHVTNIDNTLDAIQDSIKALKKKMVNLEMIANIKTIQATSKQLNVHSALNSDTADIGHESLMFVFNSTTGVKTVSNLNFTVAERLLWYISSDSANEYNMTINHLNSASVKVHTRLEKVGIRRRWLKPDIFAGKGFQMESSTCISPGPLPPKSFPQLIKENKFQFSLYTSALILATNVQISIKGPVPSYVMPSLLKMSYDRTFRGGFGPFVIGGKPFPGDISNVTFLVEQRATDILMTLPGAQLIGYVCSVVPKSCPNFIYQGYDGMPMENNLTTNHDQGSTHTHKKPDRSGLG